MSSNKPATVPADFAGLRLSQRVRELPAALYRDTYPTPVPAPRTLLVNRSLAAQLGLDPAALQTEQGAQLLSGSALPEGLVPVAQAYSGHQFGHLSPALGDGRALLLGEVTTVDGHLVDFQLKGAGVTPFSRGGDGRAALGPVLREYLVSEAMHALGVPTTRALAATATGGPVFRQAALPGAVITRIAASHLRIGSFEYAALNGGAEVVRALADYAIARHYPHAREAENPYIEFFTGVAERQARLIAQWLGLGFIHGVMNTDNASIAGETIDYGPCAFIDNFHPATVFSSIDRGGRYAYNQQSGIGQWNLTRLAECLLPLFDSDQGRAVETAKAALEHYANTFYAARAQIFAAKLGLAPDDTGAAALTDALLKLMTAAKADFTRTFRALSDQDADFDQLFGEDREKATQWRQQWQAANPDGALMQRTNPLYIPRNYWVEQALEAAYDGDLEPFERLYRLLQTPFTAQADGDYLAQSPPAFETAYQTFCGT